MAMTSPIGFEGFEKRLEIMFSCASLQFSNQKQGLRALSRAQIDSVLDLAKCTIVSQLSNEEFDSYVLSESSLFIYPLRIILKTCGTTELLLSIPRILELSSELSLSVHSAKYSRGSFIFPSAQPAPYHSFNDEVSVLDGFFGNLSSGGNAHVVGDPYIPNRNWHIYYVTAEPVTEQSSLVTLEMCMTGLDSDLATVFFKKPPIDDNDSSSKEMTKLSGISKIIPEMEICDFEFEPCGYSMNALNDGAFSTIHVSPENGSSYASYEVMGFDPLKQDPTALIKRVLRCFAPTSFSIAVTIFGNRLKAGSWANELHVKGYALADVVIQDLSGSSLLVYQTFTAKSNSPRTILNLWDADNEYSVKEAVKGVNNEVPIDIPNIWDEGKGSSCGSEDDDQDSKNEILSITSIELLNFWDGGKDSSSGSEDEDQDRKNEGLCGR
ncbi:Adenosylmethionine decarboxylase [Zostera marina]|uniref:adenosylmethionine decarboxylase n=1 Tax=Zostera marina TaxID=29655 RepID=A0A0K9P907_ZOSMR|nr:Adenosylmethionine decarboxylase [Zostera marina]